MTINRSHDIMLGGGISCCGYFSPKITNNIITCNTDLYGGGIYDKKDKKSEERAGKKRNIKYYCILNIFPAWVFFSVFNQSKLFKEQNIDFYMNINDAMLIDYIRRMINTGARKIFIPMCLVNNASHEAPR